MLAVVVSRSWNDGYVAESILKREKEEWVERKSKEIENNISPHVVIVSREIGCSTQKNNDSIHSFRPSPDFAINYLFIVVS